jgi:uncharacterized protein YjiS (DUF1127 family)
MRIWRINRSSLKVFPCHDVHNPGASQEAYIYRHLKKGEALAATAFRRKFAMTMQNITPRYATTPFRRGAGAILLARLARLINRWIAAIIARHEREADLFALRRLSDRELKDIGLYRGDISEGLAEAAKSRTRIQQTELRR